MNISTNLIVKGTAGALAAAAAIGTGIAAKNSGWFGSKTNLLTKFDEELISWLDTNGNDIVFTVKYTSSGEEKELKTSDSGVFLSALINSEENKKPVKISVEVSDDSANLKGSGKKDALKKLNGDKKWTWMCEMIFVKDSSESNVSEEHENRVYGKSGDAGLFRKLMKDIPNPDNNSKIRNIKKDFIEKCAKERTSEENKKINEPSEAIENREIKNETTIGFELKDGSQLEKSDYSLYFTEKDKFNYWFPESVNS